MTDALDFCPLLATLQCKNFFTESEIILIAPPPTATINDCVIGVDGYLYSSQIHLIPNTEHFRVPARSLTPQNWSRITEIVGDH